MRERERGKTRKFDWPVAFTKIKLMAANCTLAQREREARRKSLIGLWPSQRLN